MDRVDLGYSMMQWHSGQGDPIYMVGSIYASNRVYPDRDIAESALSSLETDLNQSRMMLANEPVMVRRNGALVSLRTFAGYSDDELRKRISELESLTSDLDSQIRSDYPEAAPEST